MKGTVKVELEDTFRDGQTLTFVSAFFDIGEDGVLIIQRHNDLIAAFNQSHWKAAWMEDIES